MFSEQDIKMTLFSGTGAGGQNRNKCQKCVRLLHIPTGIIVTAQRERSLEANKKAAYAELDRRLVELNTPKAERIETVLPEWAKQSRIADKRFAQKRRESRQYID